MKYKFVVWVIPLIFFIASFLTIPHYGISWDEPIHFSRGSAYLHYFLTGELEYSSLEKSPRHSYYQDFSQSGRYFSLNDSGHPPLNGIMAALFNYIFYQKLNLMEDITSFHLFNVVSATFLVFIVTLFAYKAYGPFAALVSGIAVSTYPLVFAEGHFNIKDPTEAAFFSATILTFWYALKKYNWKFLLLSAVFFGLALGTKFNILFLPAIIIPWLIIRWWAYLSKPLSLLKSFPPKFIAIFLTAPLIIGFIFFGSWPYLWSNPLEHTLNIFLYYKEIGTGGLGQSGYLLPGGFNLFPLVWVITTTPPIVLILSLFGVMATVFYSRKEDEKTSLLLLLWLVVPILRVSIPNSSIYGGSRQIMEFIPALALLAGLGAYHLSKLHLNISKILIILLFIPHLFILTKLHPNENVYFNFLIGGIKGAQEKNIPYWGNSFGNAYLQAVEWLNGNVPEGSKVALVQGTMVNIPKTYFRSDILFSNSFWSSIDRKGEYLIDLTHQGYQVAYPSVWEYVENVLEPVYEVKVDGVPMAKIWKNDPQHSKSNFRLEYELVIKNVKQNDQVLQIELVGEYHLSRLNMQFVASDACKEFKSGIVATSIDGKNWKVAPEKIGDAQVKEYPSLENGIIKYIFPVNKARFIQIQTGNRRSCLFNNTDIEVKGFGS